MHMNMSPQVTPKSILAPYPVFGLVAGDSQRTRIRNRTNQKSLCILSQLPAISCLEDFTN